MKYITEFTKNTAIKSVVADTWNCSWHQQFHFSNYQYLPTSQTWHSFSVRAFM